MKMRNVTTTVCLAMLAPLAIAGVSPLAIAAPVSDARSQTVQFGDLNLESQAGVQTLYVRIQSAARQVCEPAEPTALGVASAVWRNCVSTSLHDAVLKVKRPALTDYYTERLRASAFKRVE